MLFNIRQRLHAHKGQVPQESLQHDHLRLHLHRLHVCLLVPSRRHVCPKAHPGGPERLRCTKGVRCHTDRRQRPDKAARPGKRPQEPRRIDRRSFPAIEDCTIEAAFQHCEDVPAPGNVRLHRQNQGREGGSNCSPIQHWTEESAPRPRHQ